MNRNLLALTVGSILIVMVGLVAVVMWRLEMAGISPYLVIGLAFIALGAVLTTLRLTLSDDYIRRQEWEPGKDHVRQMVRRGWYAIVLGAAFVGSYYLDRWMAGP